MSLHANNLSSAINWNFQTTDIGQLFKLPSAIGKSVPVFENDLLVQKITPNYHFDVDMVRSILAFLFAENHGDGLMFYGPHGCGKTSLIREVLGRLHWPTLMLSWNETSDTADLIGRVGISFGNTEFEYGPLSYTGFWVIRPDQAARFSATLVATPSVNVTPSMSKGNWFAPFRRRHVLAAA